MFVRLHNKFSVFFMSQNTDNFEVIGIECYPIQLNIFLYSSCWLKYELMNMGRLVYKILFCLGKCTVYFFLLKSLKLSCNVKSNCTFFS